MNEQEITRRFRTRKHAVTVTYWARPDRPLGHVHVKVTSRANQYDTNHSYAFERLTYGTRAGRVVMYSAVDVRFGAQATRRLGKRDKKPGMAIARRYVTRIYSGAKIHGECGCEHCKAVGWIVDDGGRYTAKCAHCDYGFKR